MCSEGKVARRGYVGCAHRVIESCEVGMGMNVQVQHGAQPGQMIETRSISAAVEVIHQLPDLQQYAQTGITTSQSPWSMMPSF